MSGPETSQKGPNIYSRRYLNVQFSTAVVWVNSQKHGSFGYTFASLKYHASVEKHSGHRHQFTDSHKMTLTETLRSVPPICIQYSSATKGGEHQTAGLHCPVFTGARHSSLPWATWIRFAHSHSFISQSRENVKR